MRMLMMNGIRKHNSIRFIITGYNYLFYSFIFFFFNNRYCYPRLTTFRCYIISYKLESIEISVWFFSTYKNVYARDTRFITPWVRRWPSAIQVRCLDFDDDC